MLLFLSVCVLSTSDNRIDFPVKARNPEKGDLPTKAIFVLA